MSSEPRVSEKRTHILMLQMLQQLQFSVCSLGQDGCAERLHDLLDCDILSRETIFSRAMHPPSVFRQRLLSQKGFIFVPNETKCAHAHRLEIRVPVYKREIMRAKGGAELGAGLPRGCTYLDVISKVVPKICARTNSAIVKIRRCDGR